MQFLVPPTFTRRRRGPAPDCHLTSSTGGLRDRKKKPFTVVASRGSMEVAFSQPQIACNLHAPPGYGVVSSSRTF